MEFFCYHRDRVGSTSLRNQMVEQHWAYMDQFAPTMVARGPTFTSDGALTGSVHILDLPDPTAARAFAFDEPCYQAGAYRDVLLRRWHNALGRTMWDFPGSDADNRYLVLGFTLEPDTGATEPPPRDDLIAFGPLVSDDGAMVLGAAALLEAPDAATARHVLPTDRYTGVEVHRWRFGGRPTLDRTEPRSWEAGAMAQVPVDIAEKLSQVTEPWSPKVVGRINDYEIKVVKLQGEFIWHSHGDTDELFLVIDGELTIQLRDGDVVLRPGQLYVVPRGVEHCPRATGEVHAVLLEPAGVLNTGDAGGRLSDPR